MSSEIDKKTLLGLALEQLEQQRSLLAASALEAKAASTYEESKAENKYDTRGLEASYLAAGQSKRVKELEESIFILKKVKPTSYSKADSIGLTALVKLRTDDTKKWVFLVPANGIVIKYNSLKIQTMSLNSPVGQLLLDAHIGDYIELNGREFEILEIK